LHHAQRAKLGVTHIYPQYVIPTNVQPFQNNFFPQQIMNRRYPNQMIVRPYPMMTMNGNQQQQRPPNFQGQGRGRGRGRGGKTNGQVQSHLGGPSNQLAMGAQGNVAGGATGNYKYTANARNQGLASQVQVQAITQAQQADNSHPVDDAAHDANVPITIKALASAPEEQRKQMLGERLFPRIFSQQPGLAGKITGMLLEMDNGELINLLESEQALNDKIHEALTVLQQSQENEEATEQTEEDKAPS